MSVTVTVDDALLRKKLAGASLVMGKSIGELLKFYSGPAIMDLMRSFPPMGSTSGTEAFGIQRRFGLAAVGRDVAKVYVTLASVAEDVRTAANDPDDGAVRGFVRYARRGNTAEAHAMLTRLGLGQWTRPDLGQFDAKYHSDSRGRRGRVRRHRPAQIVTDVPVLRRFVKQQQDRVGLEKSGWLRGYQAAGGARSVPRWIRRHSGTGSASDLTRRKFAPTLTVRNAVRYAGDHRGIVRLSLRRSKARMVRGLTMAARRKLRRI